MKKIVSLVFALTSAFLYCNTAYPNVPNHDHPTTFVGPTARGSFTSPINDVTAFSLAGEAGLKNFRIGGTVGWRIDPSQRLKLSVEYLWQDITYAFFSGNSNHWMNQGAIGGDYEYFFDYYTFHPSFDLSGYYSHAASKELGTRSGIIVNQFGIPQIFINERRIAGSNAGGFAPGLTITPWLGSRFGLALNFDNVRYKTHFGNKSANGFGGTAHFNQMITESIGFGASAAVRKPFNNYTAKLTWANVPFYGNWTLGLYGDYTAGKESLPNSYNVGISADYFLFSSSSVPKSLNGDLKNEMPTLSVRDDFLNWTADPGVYIPQVLAVTDQRVTLITPQAPPPPPPVPTCNIAPPVAVGAEQFLTIFAPNTTTISTANLFVPATGVTYAINVTPTPTNGNTVSFNTSTGQIFINTVATQDLVITVSAVNACGAITPAAPINLSIFED